MRITKWGSVSIAVLAAFYFCLVVPCQSYLANADQFVFSLGDLLCEYGVRFGIAASVGTLILIGASRYTILLHVLTVGLIVCGMLETGPLSIGLAELNGSFAGYTSHARMIGDALVWLLVLGLGVYMRRWVARWAMAIAAALIVFTGASLLDVRCADVTLSPDGLIAPPTTLREDVVRSVQYSPEKNTFVLIVDSVSVDVVEDILDHNKELADRFTGFTEYANNVGMQWMTAVAVPGIMTGRYYESGRELGAYGKAPWRTGSFVEDAITNRIPAYINLGIGQKGYTNRLHLDSSNSKRRPSQTVMNGVFLWSVDSVSLFRLMPYVVKGKYALHIARISLGASARKKGLKNISDDRVLWPALAQAPVNLSFGSTLQVHHSIGGHEPVLFDQNGNAVKAIWKPTYADYYNQCTYILKMLADFLDKLRTKGVYDCSNIIMLGDHAVGCPRPDKDFHHVPHQAFPFLMVKPACDNDPFVKSDIPTSHSKVADLVRAFMKRRVLREEMSRILLTPNRRCHSVAMGKLTEFIVKEDGTADIFSRDDNEGDENALEPLACGKRYSFNITERSNYPDFTMINGSRDSHVGIDFYCSPMRFSVRVGKEVKKCNISLLLNLWGAQKQLVVSANGGGKETFSTKAGGDYPIVINDVSVPESGVVRIEMERPKGDPIVSVRELTIQDTTAP